MKKRTGFSNMTPERKSEISSWGGKKAHANGTAHKFTTEEASAAGKKGSASLLAKEESSI